MEIIYHWGTHDSVNLSSKSGINRRLVGVKIRPSSVCIFGLYRSNQIKLIVVSIRIHFKASEQTKKELDPAQNDAGAGPPSRGKTVVSRLGSSQWCSSATIPCLGPKPGSM